MFSRGTARGTYMIDSLFLTDQVNTRLVLYPLLTFIFLGSAAARWAIPHGHIYALYIMVDQRSIALIFTIHVSYEHISLLVT